MNSTTPEQYIRYMVTRYVRPEDINDPYVQGVVNDTIKAYYEDREVANVPVLNERARVASFLGAIGKGGTMKEIAHRGSLSVSTVRKMLFNLEKADLIQIDRTDKPFLVSELKTNCKN